MTMTKACAIFLFIVWLHNLISISLGQTYDGVEAALFNIRKCGFEPKHILDVGANVGAWTERIKGVYPSAKFFLVEGNYNHREKLIATGNQFIISLVGAERGTITYYMHPAVDSTATGNSIFRENTKAFGNAILVNASIDTLDNIVRDYEVGGPKIEHDVMTKSYGVFDLVKMDIQGAEVAAIKGATSLLSDTEVLITEAPIMNYNEGAPSFAELMVLLDMRGFAIYDMFDLARHWNGNGKLIQLDVMWVKKTSQLWHKRCTSLPKPKYFADQSSSIGNETLRDLTRHWLKMNPVHSHAPVHHLGVEHLHNRYSSEDNHIQTDKFDDEEGGPRREGVTKI